MRALSLDPAQALGLVAHTLGDLWTLHARLGAAAAGEAPSPRAGLPPNSQARPELDPLFEEALQVAEEIPPLRDRLTQLAPPSPAPGTQADDPQPDLPLGHAGIRCGLADHLEPVVDALAGLRSEEFGA